MTSGRQIEAKPYDLEERTYRFALVTRLFLKRQSWDPASWPDVRQLLRSSGSVAANYVEFIEGLSGDDKTYRLRISKKEARESGLWLRLLSDCNSLPPESAAELRELKQESDELVRILAAIIRKRVS
ncbi:hypothetical protein HAHE_39340 [Haloferula helveola]|uniref:Four helix bundle protein n=1 Tax=Haloferula helveola TaxID=490095 RepID=A0ABM7RJJ4_9BACT|nr:hypothetical protein HAHE_39340 [Haloferula helveola]